MRRFLIMVVIALIATMAVTYMVRGGGKAAAQEAKPAGLGDAQDRISKLSQESREAWLARHNLELAEQRLVHFPPTRVPEEDGTYKGFLNRALTWAAVAEKAAAPVGKALNTGRLAP
jgi:hypothetical protein